MQINTTQERMLCERGVIVLPECIEHEHYETVLGLLMLAETEWADKPIRLFCAGSGGSAHVGIALADLVQSNPQVVGVLAGIAESSHVTVFAACQRRYVYPLAQIGIHRISYHGLDSRQDAQSFAHRIKNLDKLEFEVAGVLADACAGDTLNRLWWLETIQEIGSGACDYFDAQWMIFAGMADPIADYGKARGGFIDKGVPITYPEGTESFWLPSSHNPFSEADTPPQPLPINEDGLSDDDTKPIVFDEVEIGSPEKEKLAYPITYPCPFCGASLTLYSDEVFVAPDGDWYCSESHYDALAVQHLNGDG